MANNIKGIIVEIGGNTTGLNKALDKTNKEINGTQSELKQVERLLKLDPKNTELLAQKQDLLKKAISETKDKLTSLKTAEEMAQEKFKEGKISQQQYNKLTEEILKTKDSLKNLETQASTANQVMKKVSDGAGKVAEKTKAMSTVAAGGLLALGAAAVKAGANADDLNTLASQTGIATDELQKMQYAADVVDVSVDTITGSMRKMKKNMDSNSKDVQEAWQRIGVSVTDNNGQMKNAIDIFYETTEALSKVGNETERDQIAMQIFGKSADDLAGIIDDGGASLKELGQEAENAGLIMSQEALDGANEFNDGIDRLKASSAASFGKIAGQLSEILIPALERLSKIVAKVLQWFANLSPTAKNVIILITLLVAAISPVAKIIQGIALATKALTAIKAAHAAATVAGTTATTAATAAQTGFNLAMLASPVTWIVVGIIALIAAIVLCVKYWDEIKIVAVKAWDAIKNAFSGAWQWFKSSVVDPIANLFNSIWDGIKYGAAMAWYGIKVGVISMINFVISAMNLWLKGVLAPINLVIAALNLIPGVKISKVKIEIPKVKLPEMPKMAKGGFLNYGTAIVGEAGPELLTQMGNKTKVTPLNGDYSALHPTNNTYNYGARQQITNLNVGGETIAKVIQPNISQGLSNSQSARRRAGYAY